MTQAWMEWEYLLEVEACQWDGREMVLGAVE